MKNEGFEEGESEAFIRGSNGGLPFDVRAGGGSKGQLGGVRDQFSGLFRYPDLFFGYFLPFTQVFFNPNAEIQHYEMP